MFKCCLNRNVLIGLAVVAGGVLLLAPGAFAAALPLLVLAICPLSMVLMMRGMNRGKSCETTSATTASTASIAPSTNTDAELTRLRAEIDQLKAEQAAQRNSSQRRA